MGGPGTPGNKLAEIRDTDSGDTGELRYKALLGQMRHSLPVASKRLLGRLDDDLGDGDAFITLFNSATNNSGAILDFRVKDDSFAVRSPSGVDVSALPHRLDEFMNVVVYLGVPWRRHCVAARSHHFD